MSQLREKHIKSNGSSIYGTFVVSYLKTLDMPFFKIIFSKTRTEINGTVTLKQCITLHGSKMFPQTKYGIPILHEIDKC